MNLKIKKVAKLIPKVTELTRYKL